MKHHSDTKNYLLSRLVLTVMTMLFATTSMAAWNNSTDTTPDYVDSVHSWGAWELDIEPAAGGLQSASAQVVNPRDSKVTLRINSVSALAPSAPVPSNVVASTPTVPAVPAIPGGPGGPAIPAVPAVPVAPPAATPSTPIVVNLPATSNVTPITNPNNVPSGTSGLY